MKVLLVGASGQIGVRVLEYCLASPQITEVIAFARRDLSITDGRLPTKKLQTVIVKDFSQWPEALLQQHADAAAMIWCMGTYYGSPEADFQYPRVFIESMGALLERRGRVAAFRFVFLSGKYVTRDQEAKLWFLEKGRKMKGQLETAALSYAEEHASIWKTSIVKPGGIVETSWVPGGMVISTWVPGVLAKMMMGANGCVRIEELATFMTWLAIDGQGEDALIQNARIARKGRELLDDQQR